MYLSLQSDFAGDTHVMIFTCANLISTNVRNFKVFKIKVTYLDAALYCLLFALFSARFEGSIVNSGLPARRS